MADTVSVDSDDIRTIATAIKFLQDNTPAVFFMVPGLGDAAAACSRMMQATAGCAMPESPVSVLDQMAITCAALIDAFKGQEFSRDEGLAFALAYAQSVFSASALKGAVSG